MATSGAANAAYFATYSGSINNDTGSKFEANIRSVTVSLSVMKNPPCFANCEYEGGADYDGDLWTVTADYIADLVAVAQGLYPTDLREAWTFWRPIADLGPDDRAILGVWVRELWVTADNQRLPLNAPVWTHFLLIPAPPALD